MGSIIFKIIRVAVSAITPELRNVLTGALENLKKRAAETSSPWDDILVEILISLFEGEEDIG